MKAPEASASGVFVSGGVGSLTLLCDSDELSAVAALPGSSAPRGEIVENPRQKRHRKGRNYQDEDPNCGN